MIDLQIIDNTGHIDPLLFRSDANVLLHQDEVQALNFIEKKQPSMILLNYYLRGVNTPGYIDLILEVSAHSKVVVIAEKLHEEEIINCLIAGAKGYQDGDQLAVYASKLINVINAGEAWISRRMVATVLDKLRHSQYV